MVKKASLDKTDRRILYELDKNCRTSNAMIAKKVGRSRETVKYRIQRLQDQGVITGFITSVNPSKIGYYMFKVYLKLENVVEEREKFFEELRTRKEVYWLGISDGVFDCVFAFISKNTSEYYEQINALLSQWQHLIVSKVLGMMVDTQQYTKKFLVDDFNSSSSVWGGPTAVHELDYVESQLLELLINDARLPVTKIAHKLSISQERVRSKMRNLERKGIICQYRVAVDFNRLGLEFFKLIVYFRSLSQKDEIGLQEWMRRHPKSLYYIRSIAPWEVEFEFVVENYQEFNRIVNELRGQFPHVIRNYEHLIMIYETWMPAYHYLFTAEKKHT